MKNQPRIPYALIFIEMYSDEKGEKTSKLAKKMTAYGINFGKMTQNLNLTQGEIEGAFNREGAAKIKQDPEIQKALGLGAFQKQIESLAQKFKTTEKGTEGYFQIIRNLAKLLYSCDEYAFKHREEFRIKITDTDRENKDAFLAHLAKERQAAVKACFAK